MNVIMKYFNKRQGTIEALQDHDLMEAILQNTHDDVKAAYGKMIGLGSPQVTGMPSAHNNKSGEDRIIRGLDDVALLRERYADAKEYMDWFNKAWDGLTIDEQYILRVCYTSHLSPSLAIEEVSAHFNIERTSAYKKKNRALDRFSVLLFGK